MTMAFHRLHTVLFLLMLCTSGLAQNKAGSYVLEGDHHYGQMGYARALKAYRVAAELGAVNEHVTKRLAECYLRLGDMPEAERWYAIVVKFLNREPIDMFHYAQALKSNGHYVEAEEWMDRYLATKGDGARRSNIVSFARKFAQDESRFTIKPVSINSPYSDFGTCWMNDGRVLFTSARNKRTTVDRRTSLNEQPFLDLYLADMADGGDLENVRRLQGRVNTSLHEGPATASTSGDAIWFTRNSAQKNQQGISRLGIYEATRQGDGFGKAVPFVYNNPEISNGHPSLSADGERLYFVSDMPGGLGGTDIYVVRRQGDGWGEPENLGPMINTPHSESFPFIAADGTLYFSSNGHPGCGGLDIYASLPAREGGFSSPINVGAPVNGPADDFAFIIDPTGSRGYFSSNRPDGVGSDDIYSFVMTAPLEQRFICSGLVIDDEHDIPVIAADVFLYDLKGNLLATATTDTRGEFSFPVEKDREYKLVARMPGRFDGEQVLSTDQVEQEQIITRDIHLVADVGIWMRGNVRPINGAGFIAGAVVSVVNLSSFHTDSKTTGPGGDFGFRLQTNEEFEVLIEKPGFFSQSIPVNTLGMKQGILDMNQVRDLVMEPIEPGRPILFKHIRWEDKKTTLDPVARTELDALAERLLVNRDLLVEVAVHSDARGKPNEDQRLTQKRAEAIVDHLSSRRVPRERLTAKGYGSSRLMNHCAPGVSCTEEEHAANRRNEYVVTGILE